MEQATLFYVKRKIGQGKGRESGRRTPRARVESGGIDIRAKAPDIGESSLGRAKSYGNMIRSAASATTETSIQMHKTGMFLRTTQQNENAQDVNVENPNMEKTTAAHRLQDVTMRGIQRWGTKTTISSSLASPTGSYNRGNNLFLSLTLSNCTQLNNTIISLP